MSEEAGGGVAVGVAASALRAVITPTPPIESRVKRREAPAMWWARAADPEGTAAVYGRRAPEP